MLVTWKVRRFLLAYHIFQYEKLGSFTWLPYIVSSDVKKLGSLSDYHVLDRPIKLLIWHITDNGY